MKKLLALLFCLLLFVCGCTHKKQTAEVPYSTTLKTVEVMPGFTGKPYTTMNNNIPYFTEEDMKNGKKPFEYYSELDNLGRCGVAYANICKEIMPTEKRGPIGMVKPSGWQMYKFDFIDGKYLYNRCHLIGYQLAGENANPKNLITGTRFLNVIGMLPFENRVADYVKRTNHHVLYRVTPIYTANNLVAHGVLMEARSVEDNGVVFNVFVHNVQPKVTIDYATGHARLTDSKETADEKAIRKSIERHNKKVKKQ